MTTEDALGFAIEIITSYEMDCARLPQYLAEGNDPAGFAKGYIYRDALADIERMRNKDRLSQYATVNHCRALLQGTPYMVVHEVDLDRPCYHCGSPRHRQTHATAERVAEEQMDSDTRRPVGYGPAMQAAVVLSGVGPRAGTGFEPASVRRSGATAVELPGSGETPAASTVEDTPLSGLSRAFDLSQPCPFCGGTRAEPEHSCVCGCHVFPGSYTDKWAHGPTLGRIASKEWSSEYMGGESFTSRPDTGKPDAWASQPPLRPWWVVLGIALACFSAGVLLAWLIAWLMP